MRPFSNSFSKTCILLGRRAVLCASVLLVVIVPPARSHDVITTKLTWTQEISRVVYKRCASCHRPEGSAFSLLTYGEARPWAKAIRDQVRTGKMPPWGAVKGVGEFANDPSLSAPEVDMLIAWVEGGAPEGDPAFSIDPPKRVGPMPDRKFVRQSTAKDRWEVKSPVVLGAIAAKGDGGSLEVWVEKKNGGIQRLLWVPDVPASHGRNYVLRQPLKLQTGEVVHLTGAAILSFE